MTGLIKMKDKRSGKIVVVSHCILNVHSLEDNLAIYPGLEKEIVELLIKKGVGIYQIPCPEVELAGIYRKALPKESYEHPKIRKVYRELAENITRTLYGYIKKGYSISAVLGAEGSPTCGIGLVGKWKDGITGKKEFPRDIEFIPGMGVFMEEFKSALNKLGVDPHWIGIPGKSIRSLTPGIMEETLEKLNRLI
jgi:predicted secreted protein